jgi:hypothetical protein
MSVNPHGKPIQRLRMYGGPIAYTDYPYYVEVEGGTDHHFYIADEPSYLQLVPQLVDYVSRSRIFPPSARTYPQGWCFLLMPKPGDSTRSQLNPAKIAHSSCITHLIGVK